MKKPKKKTAKKTAKKAVPVLPEDSGITEAPLETIRVMGDFPNPMWKKGQTENGESCKVWVPKRFANRVHKKTLECQRVDENGETYYKYLP